MLAILVKGRNPVKSGLLLAILLWFCRVDLVNFRQPQDTPSARESLRPLKDSKETQAVYSRGSWRIQTMAAKVLARLFVATAVVFFSTSLHSADPKQRIVLEFTDSHCPACRQMQPAVDQLVGQGWVIRQVHRAYEVELFQRWRVQQTPTLIVLQDGREVDRVVGALNYDRLLRRLTGDDASIEPRGSGRDNQPFTQGTNRNSQVQNNQGPIVRGQSPLSASGMVPLASIASSSDRSMFDDRSEGLSPVRSASDVGRGRNQDFDNLDPNVQISLEEVIPWNRPFELWSMMDLPNR